VFKGGLPGEFFCRLRGRGYGAYCHIANGCVFFFTSLFSKKKKACMTAFTDTGDTAKTGILLEEYNNEKNAEKT